MKYLLMIIFAVLISGCGVNGVKNTTYLAHGMTMQEVRGVMGDPVSSVLSNGFLVWRYSLHEPWVGYVPYNVAFDSNNRLTGWVANMNQYYATQSLWLETLPKQVNVHVTGDVDVSGSVDHNVSGTVHVKD